MFSYWQRRMSTTLQRYNAKVFNLAQLKISKAGGSRVNEFDIHHAVSHEIPTHIMDIA